MDYSDWVLVVTSLFLGATALFVPWLAELVKRKAFAPKLKVRFDLAPPYCIKTYWHSPTKPELEEPVYYFRFEVTNDGQSQARHCEAVLEELWIYDPPERPHRVPSFSPVNLRCDGRDSLDINPHRRGIYWAMGHISSSSYQQREERSIFIDVPDRQGDHLRFLFDLVHYPYSQPSCLAPGGYAIKVAVYSENAPSQEVCFKIVWSGQWRDTEQDMFREMVVQRIDSIR